MAGLKRITDLPAAGTIVGTELLELSQVSTTVTITATTISAAASDNSYNDSGSGFVTAGFAVGDRVRVTGFTGNTANNILVGTITALTAGKMTIGGTDGDVIVDDAAGESVTISKWTSRRLALDDLPSAGGTNLSYTAATRVIASDTGTDATLPLVTSGDAGLAPASGGGTANFLRADGTWAAPAGAGFYDIGAFISGTVLASELVFRLQAVRAFALPSTLSTSRSSAVDASTGTAVFSLAKNGTQFGTLTFTTSATGVFAAATDTSFAIGDILTITGPGTADATLANISINLRGSVV